LDAFSDGSFEKLKNLIAQVPKGEIQTKALMEVERKLNPQQPLDREAEMKSAWQACLAGEKGLSK